MIIPTYNECDNITALIGEITQRGLDTDFLVVDDNSPDGTSEVVAQLAKSNPRVHLLRRPGKQGLGRAYIAGFGWGLEKGYEFLVEMDADFSHRPEDLEQILAHCGKADFIVGSRYVTGGGTLNWKLSRKILSRFGSLYARTILGLPFNDLTGGFNGWRASVLNAIGLSNIKSDGYSFQIELKYRAHQLKFKGMEIPIIFNERREGQSKMSGQIVFEALFRVWSMRFGQN